MNLGLLIIKIMITSSWRLRSWYSYHHRVFRTGICVNSSLCGVDTIYDSEIT